MNIRRFIYMVVLASFIVIHVFPVKISATAHSVYELEEYTQSYFQEKVNQGEIPGAVISVVLEDKILFSTGIGFANKKNKIQNDPAKTLIRAGSIGKTVTSTAAMQLLEKNHWQPKEVNVWDDLSVQPLNDVSESPVTIHHLLTHTSGYDEMMVNFYANNKEDVSFSKYIKFHQPAMIRQPGQEIEYSNFGMTLLGQWVEDISEMEFSNYIDQSIFKPLSMNNSTFDQDHRLEHLANSYMGDDLYPYSYLHIVPAGTITTTAEDMARFMIAHLNHDQALGTQWLYDKMHATHHRMEPEIPGMAYGFYEGELHGFETLRHEGSVDAFLSEMVLVPEAKLGVFVSLNGATGNETSYIIREYIEEITEKLLPSKSREKDHYLFTSKEELRNIEGTYAFNRKIENGPLRMLSLFSLPTLSITVLDDGLIEVDDIFLPKIKHEFVEVNEPFSFVNLSSNERIVFQQENNTFISSSLPQIVFTSTGWTDGRWLTFFSFGLITIVSLFYLILIPVRAIYRKRKGRSDDFKRVRILLFFLSFTTLLSIITILPALSLIVDGSLLVSILLLMLSLIPVIISVMLVLQLIKRPLPLPLKSGTFILIGCAVVLQLLFFYWELTPIYILFTEPCIWEGFCVN